MIPPSIGAPGRSFQTVTVSTAASGRTTQARGLDGLGQQALDLAGDRGRGGVAVLGEDVVALPAAGELGEQQLVVAQADADGRGRDAVIASAGGDPGQPRRVGLAGVGVAVGEQQQRGAAVGRDAPGLLQPAQQAAGEVGHAARCSDRRSRAGRRACRSAPPAGTTTWTSSSKATTPKRSVGSSRSTRRTSACLAASSRSPSIEPLRSSTTWTVGGRSRPSVCGGGRDELEHHGDLVVLLDGDDVDISVGVHLHAVLLESLSQSGSRPSPGGLTRRRPLRQVRSAQHARARERAALAHELPERRVGVDQPRAAAAAARLGAAAGRRRRARRPRRRTTGAGSRPAPPTR